MSEASELPKRKRTRLEDYDYSSSGAYFVTICTKDKRRILCDVVRDGALDVPYIRLKSYGKLLDYEIKKSMDVYKHIKIDKYVIMPNHIHMIIIILDDLSGTSRAPSRTNETLPSFVSMIKRFTNKKCGRQLWHRSFYDRIIRNRDEYEKIWKYIDENPLKWEEDEYYCS